jgi:hypothetical protein
MAIPAIQPISSLGPLPEEALLNHDLELLIGLGLSVLNLATCCDCYKTFYGCKLCLFVISYNVCPWQAVQPSLMLEGKARSLP